MPATRTNSKTTKTRSSATSKKKPLANEAKTGPEVMDAMEGTVTLDRFLDRNPWSGGKAAQRDYVKRTVEVARRERALYIAKEQSK